MSCIRFTTEAMRKQFLTAQREDEPVAQFLSPKRTEQKMLRIERLAENDNYKIRESAALSHFASKSTLAKLAKDDVVSVRECVARNPYASLATIFTLAEDESERVRAFVANNTSTPQTVLQKLATDKSELVRNVAKLHLQ